MRAHKGTFTIRNTQHGDCDNELWHDDTGRDPQIHPNLAYNDKSLATFLQQLNARRLRSGMTVDILSQHNKAVVDVGVVKEIIPHEQFSGDTGHFHDAVVAVRMGNGTVSYFSPERVIPSELLDTRRTREREVEVPNKHDD